MRRRSLKLKRQRAMTLLEVILSMGLLVILSSLTYQFYYASLSSKASGTERAADLRLTRTVLQRMSEEIRQAVVQSKDFGMGIAGGQEAIEITTLRVPRRELAQERLAPTDPIKREYDLVKIQYKIARHPDIVSEAGWEQPLGLVRIEKLIPRRLATDRSLRSGKSIDPNNPTLPDQFHRDLVGLSTGGGADSGAGSGIAPEVNWEELYAPDIHYIRFCYYDGYSWWDNWHVTGENPLPQLIHVTIGFGDHAPLDGTLGVDDTNEQFCACLNKRPSDCDALSSDEYSTVVRVTRADPLFRSRVSREGQKLSQDLIESELAGHEGGSQ
jgi:type II secretory pathway pseudopilin PulG